MIVPFLVSMDDWNSILDLLEQVIGKRPESLESIIFIIGLQELGKGKQDYTKEQKQDIIHIGICSLLSTSGYYEYLKDDNDGWPHYTLVKPIPKMKNDMQDEFLKKHIIDYFKKNLL